ncbi:hypothetical protein [Minisyncoccus archaeiphilus]|uniref:hypothetical protein n=1 Tax=Minisyncoccus archaeiphilus TaxID=3238481 RepID=UPI00399CF9A3
MRIINLEPTNYLVLLIKKRLLSFRNPAMGAIVEDVRTGFEKRGDTSVTIPAFKEDILL